MFLTGLKSMLKFVFLEFLCLDLHGLLKIKNLLIMKELNPVKRIIPFRNIEPTYSKFSRTEIEKDGVLRPAFQYIEYSAIEDIKSSEYSLGNLVAIGAVDGMKYVSMSLNSDMNFVDDFAKSYQNATSDVQ